MKVGFVSKFPEQEDGIAIYSASLCDKLEEAGVEIIKIGDLKSTSAKYKIDFKSFFLKGELAKIAKGIERLRYFPQEIEWAIERGKIYLVNSKPITI